MTPRLIEQLSSVIRNTTCSILPSATSSSLPRGHQVDAPARSTTSSLRVQGSECICVLQGRGRQSVQGRARALYPRRRSFPETNRQNLSLTSRLPDFLPWTHHWQRAVGRLGLVPANHDSSDFCLERRKREWTLERQLQMPAAPHPVSSWKRRIGCVIQSFLQEELSFQECVLAIYIILLTVFKKSCM